jgi:hypothetical protein
MSDVTMLSSAGSLEFLRRINGERLSLVISRKGAGGDGYKAEAFDQSNVTSIQWNQFLKLSRKLSSDGPHKRQQRQGEKRLFRS